MKFPVLSVFALALAISGQLRATDKEPKIYVLETDVAKLESGAVPSKMRLSPDGKRALQLVVRDDQYFIAINEQMSPAYDGVTKDSLRFSPDGKRYCYGARIGERKFVIVDGQEYPAFDGPSELHVLTLRDGRVIRARIDVLEQWP